MGPLRAMPVQKLPAVALVLPFAAWPVIDRALMTAAFRVGEDLESLGSSIMWRPATRVGVLKGWGRYLQFLIDADAFDPRETPSQRVTPARYQAYLLDLLAAGNGHNTLQTRCMELKMALDAMEPDKAPAFAWITRPGGRSIRDWMPTTLKAKAIIDSRVLWQWAMDLVATADAAPSPEARARAVRDGVIIAVLTVAAPRLHALVSLQIGRHFVKAGDRYHISFASEDMKAGRPLDYDLPAELTPAIERYLHVERPVLLAGQGHSFLWVSTGGGPLQEDGVQGMIPRRAQARFNLRFGPHRFRDCLATACANLLPDSPGMAASILGAGKDVVAQSYAQTSRIVAANAYVDAIEQARMDTVDLANSLFSNHWNC